MCMDSSEYDTRWSVYATMKRGWGKGNCHFGQNVIKKRAGDEEKKNLCFFEGAEIAVFPLIGQKFSCCFHGISFVVKFAL